MKYFVTLLVLMVSVLAACQIGQTNTPQDQRNATELYAAAAAMVVRSEHDSALVLLRQAFQAGLEQPMQITGDPAFYPLIDDPVARPEVRTLLKEFAKDHEARMIRTNESGEPLRVNGRIVDENTRQPLAGVIVELIHADGSGLYFNEKSTWNPRIFAYLKTNENGEFAVNTIRPGRYRDDLDQEVPAHIHFTFEKAGYRPYGSEITFEDDPVIRTLGNTEGVPVAKRMGSDSLHYEVVVPMQAE